MSSSRSRPPLPACAFASDNAAGAHPAVIEAIARVNHGHALAYGDDDETRACHARFGELFDQDVDVLLTLNGTGANVLALAVLLEPAEAVVCARGAHIAVDETGAPERILGVKLIELPTEHGKLVPDQLDELSHLVGVQHHVQPGVLSLTQSTEQGTLYTVEEIRALTTRAHELDMRVHLDGARLANAVAALGADRHTLRSMTVGAGVDVVTFGGTKNGLIGAEAVIVTDQRRARRARYLRKQVNQLASKMRFLAAQFNAVLDGDLWLDLAGQANASAQDLYHAVSTIPQVRLDGPPAVNSLFPVLPRRAIEPLQDWCFFWEWDPPRDQVRWMTAWDTTAEDVRTFAAGVREILAEYN